MTRTHTCVNRWQREYVTRSILHSFLLAEKLKSPAVTRGSVLRCVCGGRLVATQEVKFYGALSAVR